MREAIREPVKYYFGDAVRNRGVWVGGLAPFFCQNLVLIGGYPRVL